MTASLRLNSDLHTCTWLFILLVSSRCATSFQSKRPPLSLCRKSAASIYSKNLHILSTRVILNNENPQKNSAEVPEEEIIGETFVGSVDWDAEWKKVVENRDQPTQRPGKYKTQVEINAIKTTNKVAKNVFDASKELNAKLPQLPSVRSLQGDWKFWIGVLVIVSFGLSILSVSGQTSVNESFYI